MYGNTINIHTCMRAIEVKTIYICMSTIYPLIRDQRLTKRPPTNFVMF